MIPATRITNEDQIRALLGERVQAVRDRDARALTSARASFLNRVSGTMTNGTTVDMWLRSTLGLAP